MDDFSAFVQFRVFDAFAGVFRQLVRDAAAIDTTFVLGLGEPANDASKNLLRFIEGEVSGTVHTTTANDDVYEDTNKALYLPAKRSLEADLRAAREAADLTIEDIHQETRLATNILKRFEAGRLIGDTSFNSVYLKAFLRLYANAVGLGPQKVEVALEAVRRGTYRGELHPSYAGSDGGVTVEEEPNSPTSDSGHLDADYVAPKEPVFPQVDPLPEAIPAASALPYSETKPTRRLQKKVRPSSGRSSDTAWGALLNVTVRRLLNRTEVDVHALTERREGGVPPSDVRSNSRLS